MDDREVANSTSSDNEEMPPLEGGSEEEGDSLITRRALSVQPKEDEEDLHREHIFYTRSVNNKVCSMIIDSDSYTNVASTLFVDKLGLETVRHPKPYKLH